MAETGTVKFFNTDKGYGFIKPDNGESDIFVHISAVKDSGLETGLFVVAEKTIVNQNHV